ncbi:hypothetical protein EDD15DRAFT_1520188 [Pisolithus albus]|nr:hypothetical protein EDD15DRAFT_1520188 [Pisolithus albus]
MTQCPMSDLPDLRSKASLYLRPATPPGQRPPFRVVLSSRPTPPPLPRRIAYSSPQAVNARDYAHPSSDLGLATKIQLRPTQLLHYRHSPIAISQLPGDFFSCTHACNLTMPRPIYSKPFVSFYGSNSSDGHVLMVIIDFSLRCQVPVATRHQYSHLRAESLADSLRTCFFVGFSNSYERFSYFRSTCNSTGSRLFNAPRLVSTKSQQCAPHPAGYDLIRVHQCYARTVSECHLSTSIKFRSASSGIDTVHSL